MTTVRQRFLERLVAKICAKNLSQIKVDSALLNQMAEEVSQISDSLQEYYAGLSDKQMTRLLNEAQKWAKYDYRSNKIAEKMEFRLITEILLPLDNVICHAGTHGKVIGFDDFGVVCQLVNGSRFIFDGREGTLEFFPKYLF